MRRIVIHSPLSGLCIVFMMTVIELCGGTLLILAMVRVFCVLSENHLFSLFSLVDSLLKAWLFLGFIEIEGS